MFLKDVPSVVGGKSIFFKPSDFLGETVNLRILDLVQIWQSQNLDEKSLEQTDTCTEQVFLSVIYNYDLSMFQIWAINHKEARKLIFDFDQVKKIDLSKRDLAINITKNGKSYIFTGMIDKVDSEFTKMKEFQAKFNGLDQYMIEGGKVFKD
jgi:hypothetical protein